MGVRGEPGTAPEGSQSNLLGPHFVGAAPSLVQLAGQAKRSGSRMPTGLLTPRVSNRINLKERSGEP